MLQSIWDYFLHNKFEAVTSLLGIVYVWLASIEKISNWPVGIIASAMSVYLYYDTGIYADAWLSVFYVVIGFYGWYEWLYGGKDKKHLPISRSPVRSLFIMCLVTIPAYFIISFILKKYTDSNIPFLDGITTALSLTGTWMQAKKLIENWLVWIVVDSLYVVEYAVKHIYMQAGLSFIFVVLAIYGYVEWKKLMKAYYA